MNKNEFLSKLQKKLSNLPQKEVEERLTFYSEMIDDRVEEGVLEETAVAQIGNIDDIAEQIKTELPHPSIERQTVRQKEESKTWQNILFWVGSPIWFSIFVVLFAVVVSFYAVTFALTLVLWAVFILFTCCPFALLAVSFLFFYNGSAQSGIAAFGLSCIFSGLAIFAFFGAQIVTKSVVKFTKNSFLFFKKRLKGVR